MLSTSFDANKREIPVCDTNTSASFFNISSSIDIVSMAMGLIRLVTCGFALKSYL